MAIEITSISPITGWKGDTITLYGSGFSGPGMRCFIGAGSFGSDYYPTIISDTEMTTVVQNGVLEGHWSVVVYSNDGPGWSNWFDGIDLANPAVQMTGINGNTNPSIMTVVLIGDTLTISGRKFGEIQDGSTLKTADGVDIPITSWSDTEIIGTMPSITTYANQAAVVTVLGNSSQFRLDPVDESALPTGTYTVSARSGISCGIWGNHFGRSSNTLVLHKDGETDLPCSISYWSNSYIQWNSPSGTPGEYLLRISSVLEPGYYDFGIFTLEAEPAHPVIADVNPKLLKHGDTFTITGTGFGTTPYNVIIGAGSFGGHTVQSWTDTEIVCTLNETIPDGTGYFVAWYTGTEWSNWWTSVDVYSEVTAPTVTGRTPASGPVNTEVTITGTGFGASQGAGFVVCGGPHMPIVSWNDTEIKITISADCPMGNNSMYVIVEGFVDWINANGFERTEPVVPPVGQSNNIGGLRRRGLL